MRRLELETLLPAGIVSHQTRDELLREAAQVSTGPVSAAASAGSTSTTADALSGLLQGPTKDVTQQLSALASQITALNSTQQTQIGATQDNTQAVSQNTAAKGSGGSSFASTAGHVASSLLGGGLSPISGGLISLFGGGGGGGTQTVTAPTPFRLPASVDNQAGLSAGPSGGAVQPVMYAAGEQPRALPASSSTQVNIQVNAMDSRSFLDHSEEIAQAVKAAMLSSSSLNDVIADL